MFRPDDKASEAVTAVAAMRAIEMIMVVVGLYVGGKRSLALLGILCVDVVATWGLGALFGGQSGFTGGTLVEVPDRQFLFTITQTVALKTAPTLTLRHEGATIIQKKRHHLTFSHILGCVAFVGSWPFFDSSIHSTKGTATTMNIRLSASLAALLLVSSSSALQPLQRAATTKPSTTSTRAVAVPLTAPEELITSSTSDDELDPQDQWIAKLDYEGFGREVAALGKELLQEGGQDDVDHLNKMVSWRNWCAVVGVASCWLAPNPVTVLALSTWTYSSWTMIAHHVCHGGYNRVDADGFNSRGFALNNVGQRIKDWLDWMAPEAWNVEHNRLHHYRLNEVDDPDLVQRNLLWLRDSNVPDVAKYATVAFFLPIWKWFYYAPNTFKELQVNKMAREGTPLPEAFDAKDAITVPNLFIPGEKGDAIRQVVNPVEFFTKVVGPFFFMRFVALPAPLLAIPGVGPTLFGHAIVNMILAELLTNIHAFITIVTNHAGSDLYTFDDAVKPKTPSFYVRQIIGSANYATGSDLVDFSHGWLNYQIEHHVWPDLSMLQYQKGAPKLKAICAKYGVPYVQESVFTRLQKTVDIMVGKSTMRKFPTQYEPAKDKAKTVTWKSSNGAIDEDDEQPV